MAAWLKTFNANVEGKKEPPVGDPIKDTNPDVCVFTEAYHCREHLKKVADNKGYVLKMFGKDEGEEGPDIAVLVRETIKIVKWEPEIMQRAVNAGFSGGEKKRNEILQMAVLEPKLAVLDETDSGLDIDALRIVADGVNALRREDRSVILVTHYQRLLNYIVPDHVHVLAGGRIVRSGGKELAHELEAKGYEWITGPVEAVA